MNLAKPTPTRRCDKLKDRGHTGNLLASDLGGCELKTSFYMCAPPLDDKSVSVAIMVLCTELTGEEVICAPWKMY